MKGGFIILSYLTVDCIAMAISRMAPSHFLWKKPYECWDTVSQLCRKRLNFKLIRLKKAELSRKIGRISCSKGQFRVEP